MIKPPFIAFYTRSGHKTDLWNIQPGQISLKDIANGLANQGRYNGQTKEFYSVAEHCVHLARYARKKGLDLRLQRYLLMHDASEAYCGDIVYHLKANLEFFKEVEERILRKTYYAFGMVYDEIPEMVLKLDRAVCLDEMSQLMKEVDPNLSIYQPLGIKVKCWNPKKARKMFLKEAKRLKIRSRYETA